METTLPRIPARMVADIDRLRANGITSEQIARLVILRETYPLTEFVGSRKDVDRLRFLKWRYNSGLVDESRSADSHGSQRGSSG